jgi:ferric-dicitrate binding protein FerR (iron transport regulator)
VVTKELIEKYLEGRCSSEEIQLVDDYLESFQEVNKDWTTAIHGDKYEIGEKIYQKIEEKIGSSTGRIIRISTSKYLLRIAASIAIIAVSSIFIWQSLSRNNSYQTVFNTGNSQVEEISLADGTVVRLNANSTLTFPGKFAGRKRTVELDGEAYFEVSHNKRKTFIVHTSSADINVLGTKFNLEAYSQDPVLIASLIEGSIELISDNSKSILKPGQELMLDKDERKAIISTFDPKSKTAWVDHELCFENTPLPDALRRIENYYGITVEVENNLLLERKITGSFKKNSIEEIANKLDTLFQANIKYKENMLVIR